MLHKKGPKVLCFNNHVKIPYTLRNLREMRECTYDIQTLGCTFKWKSVLVITNFCISWNPDTLRYGEGRGFDGFCFFYPYASFLRQLH